MTEKYLSYAIEKKTTMTEKHLSHAIGEKYISYTIEEKTNPTQLKKNKSYAIEEKQILHNWRKKRKSRNFWPSNFLCLGQLFGMGRNASC